MNRRARGFTLVEAIVVMVITSILAGIMVLFIRRPVQSYVDTAARADLADVAEIALRRMTRELRGAVPGSIRLAVLPNGTSLLEFIPSVAGGRYLDVSDGADPANAGTPPLDFVDSTQLRFYVVTPMPVAPYAIKPEDSIIVYNLGSGFVGADAYAANPANRATVAPDGVNGKVITLNSNPFPGGATQSPGKRFIVARAPVTFSCVNSANGTGVLSRFWGYGFQPTQVNPVALNGVQTALMASNVLGCIFSATQQANQNTALIGLSIALARPSPDAPNGRETVTLAHQIHVDNTP